MICCRCGSCSRSSWRQTGVIWGAGILLSETTDTLDSRLHLGMRSEGLIVLGVHEPAEVAITVSAALAGNVDIAVGNILGGIAIQTVVIAYWTCSEARAGRKAAHLPGGLAHARARGPRRRGRAHRRRRGQPVRANLVVPG